MPGGRCLHTDPTTSRGNRSGIEEFYDALAEGYDGMTGFEKRFVAERPFFRLIVERFGIRRALDAGAGTGFHSLLLTELGVRMAAVDVSAEMIGRLAAHARERGIEIDARRGEFAALPSAWDGEFDALFCLGNSLPHLLGRKELSRALRSFRRVLRDGGACFLQLLNYERILRSRERIVGVKEEGGRTYIRFYDFEEGRIRFNILRLARSEGRMEHRLQGVELHPWMPREITDEVRRAGFGEIGEFGGMSMEPFDPVSSRDLVVVAVAR